MQFCLILCFRVLCFLILCFRVLDFLICCKRYFFHLINFAHHLFQAYFLLLQKVLKSLSGLLNYQGLKGACNYHYVKKRPLFLQHLLKSHFLLNPLLWKFQNHAKAYQAHFWLGLIMQQFLRNHPTTFPLCLAGILQEQYENYFHQIRMH